MRLPRTPLYNWVVYEETVVKHDMFLDYDIVINVWDTGLATVGVTQDLAPLHRFYHKGRS